MAVQLGKHRNYRSQSASLHQDFRLCRRRRRTPHLDPRRRDGRARGRERSPRHGLTPVTCRPHILLPDPRDFVQ